MTSETIQPVYEPATICPRCQHAQNWNGASWCPTCGFHQHMGADALADESWKEHVADDDSEQADDENLLESMPAWFKVMAGGIFGILIAGLTIRMLLPEEHPRGLIAVLILLAGIVTVLAAHIVATRYALKHDTRARIADAFVSWMVVWHPTFQDLPETRKRTWAAAWGITIIVTATTVIGGINYNAPFQTELPLPERVRVIKGRRVNLAQEAGKAFVQAATKGGTHDVYIDELMATPGSLPQGDGQMDMEQAIGAMTAAAGVNMQDVQEQMQQAIKAVKEAPQKQTIEAIIYGVVHTDGVATSFLFAARVKGDYRHVAEIFADRLTPTSYQSLTMRLKNKAQEHPAIPTDREDAVWVTPTLVCRLHYTEKNEEHVLKDADFDKVLKEVVKSRRSGR